MAGSHHTGRRPNRISSIGRRDARAIADARRVSEADLRLAIYVRPDGLGIHVVKNPCNGQEYKVADATAGATFSAGAAVVLGSFTGNPGEMILGRPPAGFGGASGYSVNKVNVSYVGATTNSVTFDVDAATLQDVFAYDPYRNGAALAYSTEVATEDGAQLAWGVVRVPRAFLPIAFADIAAAAVTVGRAVNQDPADGADARLLAVAPGPIYVLLYVNGTGGANGSLRYRVGAMSAEGAELAADSYYGPDTTGYRLGYCVAGGKLFMIEPLDSQADLSGGPPYSSLVRVTQRSASTLEIMNSYAVPSVDPFNGSASDSQVALGIVPSGSGGGIHLYLEATNGSGILRTVWRRTLTADLVPDGADVQITNSGDSVALAYTPPGSAFVRTPAGVYTFARKKSTGSGVDDLVAVGASTLSDLSLDTTIAAKWLDRDTSGTFFTMDSTRLSVIDPDGTVHFP